MGLTHSQWDSLDAPYWQKFDSEAVKRAGGIFIGDLPSSMKGYTMGYENGFTIVYHHPSIDSSHYEKHIWIYVPKPKK